MFGFPGGVFPGLGAGSGGFGGLFGGNGAQGGGLPFFALSGGGSAAAQPSSVQSVQTPTTPSATENPVVKMGSDFDQSAAPLGIYRQSGQGTPVNSGGLGQVWEGGKPVVPRHQREQTESVAAPGAAPSTNSPPLAAPQGIGSALSGVQNGVNQAISGVQNQATPMVQGAISGFRQLLSGLSGAQ